MLAFFRSLCFAALAVAFAAIIFVSDARASGCVTEPCVSPVRALLKELRENHTSSARTQNNAATLAPTLDSGFVRRVGLLQRLRDSNAWASSLRTSRRSAFVERRVRALPDLTTRSTRITSLFGLLQRHRFQPKVYIETPEQGIHTVETISSVETRVASVPLPATLPLALAGFGALAVLRRRKQRY